MSKQGLFLIRIFGWSGHPYLLLLHWLYRRYTRNTIGLVQRKSKQSLMAMSTSTSSGSNGFRLLPALYSDTDSTHLRIAIVC
jgi:hypothetical protein